VSTSSRHSLIQTAIADRIKAQDEIDNPTNAEQDHFVARLKVPVHEDASGNWLEETARKIKTIGLAIVVRKGLYTIKGVFETFPFLVEIVEVPLINRGTMGTGLTAERAMEIVTECLRHWGPLEWTGEVENLVVNGKEGQKQLTYAIRFDVRSFVKETARAL